MKKKYLSKTSVTDNKEALEYTLLAGLESFYVIITSKRDDRRLKLPYEDFSYPQFISEDAIFEELKERIEKFFEEECEEKLILLRYCSGEEMKMKQIIMENKKEFNL